MIAKKTVVTAEAAESVTGDAKPESNARRFRRLLSELNPKDVCLTALPARLIGATGERRQFLRYGEPVVTLDPRRYLANELPEILGVLQYVVEEALGIGEQSA